MTAQYAATSRPTFSAADFQRDEPAAEAGTFAPTPIYARTAARRRRVNPAIWAILPVAALAIGIGAYVMNTPKDDLMVSTASPPASARPLTPQLAQTTPTMAPEAPAKDLQSFKSESVRTQVAAAKPAPHKALAAHKTASAETAGVNASAAVPAAPMAYAPAAQAPTTPAPVVAAPPPATVMTPEVVVPPGPTPEVSPQG